MLKFSTLATFGNEELNAVPMWPHEQRTCSDVSGV